MVLGSIRSASGVGRPFAARCSEASLECLTRLSVAKSDSHIPLRYILVGNSASFHEAPDYDERLRQTSTHVEERG